MVDLTLEAVAAIRRDLKKTFPDFKFAISLQPSHLKVRILSGPLRFDDPNESNKSNVKSYWQLCKNVGILQKILDVVLKEKFDTHVSLTQGEYSKPYAVVPFKGVGAEMLFRMKHNLLQCEFS